MNRRTVLRRLLGFVLSPLAAPAAANAIQDLSSKEDVSFVAFSIPFGYIPERYIAGDWHRIDLHQIRELS